MKGGRYNWFAGKQGGRKPRNSSQSITDADAWKEETAASRRGISFLDCMGDGEKERRTDGSAEKKGKERYAARKAEMIELQLT